MTDSERLAFILRLFSILAKWEAYDDIWWRTDGTYAPVTFWVNCNDLFWWATADSEEVNPANIEELAKAYEDAEAADQENFGHIYGSTLFCCRMRKMRPQGACYPKKVPKLWPLLDACGPERPTDKAAFGNPYPPGGGF